MPRIFARSGGNKSGPPLLLLHFIPEELPDATATAIGGFMAAP